MWQIQHGNAIRIMQLQKKDNATKVPVAKVINGASKKEIDEEKITWGQKENVYS